MSPRRWPCWSCPRCSSRSWTPPPSRSCSSPCWRWPSWLGCTVGPQSALFAELFPAHVRYSGASLGYQVGAILGGGIAPLLATWLYAEFGTTMAVSAYFVVVSTISLVCTLVLRRRPHRAEEPTPGAAAVAQPAQPIAAVR